MSFLRIENLHKRFDRVVAVAGLNLDVKEGEFFTLLGSSGCGKTTTLRMVGGLEKPDGGAIHLGDQCLVSAEKNLFIKPEKRNMGMVFQSYALWPHMTVFENISYPLKLRGIKGRGAEKKVADVLGLVGLAGLEERPAPALSGGQQQRVALARALVFSPKVLLLDEPLSNLDAQLREEMRRELKLLQRRVNVTVIFVTHDQIEALSLSDRIAIMKFGELEQVGTPEDVYYHPTTPFVRDFLGKTFLLSGKVAAVSDQRIRVEVQGVGASALTLATPQCRFCVERLPYGRTISDGSDSPREDHAFGKPRRGRRQLRGRHSASESIPRRSLRVHRYPRFGNPRYRLARGAATQAGRQSLPGAKARRHDLVAQGRLAAC